MGLSLRPFISLGSQNNNQPDAPRAVEEFVARDKANKAWLENAFAKVLNLDSLGMAILILGFTCFLEQLHEFRMAFTKPFMVPIEAPIYPCRRATYA